MHYVLARDTLFSSSYFADYFWTNSLESFIFCFSQHGKCQSITRIHHINILLISNSLFLDFYLDIFIKAWFCLKVHQFMQTSFRMRNSSFSRYSCGLYFLTSTILWIHISKQHYILVVFDGMIRFLTVLQRHISMSAAKKAVYSLGSRDCELYAQDWTCR